MRCVFIFAVYIIDEISSIALYHNKLPFLIQANKPKKFRWNSTLISRV